MEQLYDFEDLSFKSNYYIGYFAQGGMFIIKNEVAVFKAHALNIGDLSEKIIPISEICGYRKGALTALHIFLFNGKEIKLAVWKKDAVIKALEERRHAIYKNQGKDIPQLNRF